MAQVNQLILQIDIIDINISGESKGGDPAPLLLLKDGRFTWPQVSLVIAPLLGLNSWSYLFRGPSDQTAGQSASFAIETNGILLIERIKLVRQTTQITCKKNYPRVVHFQW